ncbi:Zn-dependent alcohol dehydrogenase [Arthrobacter pigmenti]|uniref:Zn-dependent alcohol dehydrogenase n=1 Tax=Arthrobacter pigmenti TaxID=271432 RepID=A0A846RTB4_9MICC|nr:TadE family type IV pilus minor pilin [Arthrobacter pigmenti]NJC23417.1 Zn-dependent alcohol dehydrogenase [Arthrobacter pigmenti]
MVRSGFGGRRVPRTGDAGAVTAEVAVALPAVVALIAVVLAAASVGLTQLRIEEAARAGAREIMRGESPEVVDATIRRIAGDGTQLAVESSGSFSSVVVSTTVDAPVLNLFELDLSARAYATPEAP